MIWASCVSFTVASFGLLRGFFRFALSLRALLQLVAEIALSDGSPLLLPVLFSPSAKSSRDGVRLLRPISLDELRELGDMFAPIFLEHPKHESRRNPSTTITINCCRSRPRHLRLVVSIPRSLARKHFCLERLWPGRPTHEGQAGEYSWPTWPNL